MNTHTAVVADSGGCYPSRCLTMSVSWSVPMWWCDEAPGMGGAGGLGRHRDVGVVVGDVGCYSLFSVIAACAAPWSTMALSVA